MGQIKVKTGETRFATTPDLYGLFFEDISRAGDGGLYPEMLRNRSFEDSLIPPRCTTDDCGRTFVSPTGWIDEFNNGEGMHDWVRDMAIVPTAVPGWYAENAEMELDHEVRLNEKREVSLKVKFAAGGCLKNIGFCGIPQKAGEQYLFYGFFKADKEMTLTISAVSEEGESCSAQILVPAGEWTRCDASLVASKTSNNAVFYMTAAEEGELNIGFTSLMPADTFCGHGLRKDLAEKLAGMNPAFLRFPGGCSVDGFTIETAMYFRNTVGPVWERPSHWLLWHYRSTNGLGFHEYLQLCEDLGIEAMYVCNCGMTCQGRSPYFFNQEETDDMLQDVLNAFEYALGGTDTKWGALRAQMGHPEPFTLKYLEIGNENSGHIYNEKFEYFRQAVIAKYPDTIIVANDRAPEHITDIVDDHYYNMPEYFAEKIGIYDDYDRTRPDVFVGEFSVNQTYEGQLKGAVAEAMFMIGFERNQDKVKLCAYAPLFQHVHYSSWYPNLIIYDNSTSYGIPSYYVYRLFGGNRGDNLVVSEEKTEKIYRDFAGLPLITGDEGVEWKNAVYNGVPVAPMKNVFGKAETTEDGYVIVNDPDRKILYMPEGGILSAICLGEKSMISRVGSFEAEVKTSADKAFGVGALYAPKPLSYYDRHNPNPRDPWDMWNCEPVRFVIKGDTVKALRGGFRPETLAEGKVSYTPDVFAKMRCDVDNTHARLYLDGELVLTAELPHYPAMASVVTTTDEDIIIKVVNFADEEDNVEISLDVPVASEYHVQRLSGPADGENTLDAPETISDENLVLNGAGECFTYTAPVMSVNVLVLKKA